MINKDEIKALIEQNKIEQALNVLNGALEISTADDELYFLRGNVYRKLGQWKPALDDYCEAAALNPESPAAFAYDAVQQILEFYNKDMYNP